MDQGKIARYQFAKGFFRAIPDIIRKQLLAVRHLQFIIKNPHQAKTEQKVLKKMAPI